jgi:hypothetical protein
MSTGDPQSTLRSTLVEKQKLVRDYQAIANDVQDKEVAKMYSHFAEAEALQATEIKQKLDNLT